MNAKKIKKIIIITLNTLHILSTHFNFDSPKNKLSNLFFFLWTLSYRGPFLPFRPLGIDFYRQRSIDMQV